MMKLIIEKELREIIGSMKFAVTFAVTSLLLLLTFYVGARNFQMSTEQYNGAKGENLRKLENLTDWQEVRNFRVFLPPRPISSLIMGVSNDIGRTSEIHGQGEITPRDSRYGDDPVYAVFRFLDLDFIFQIVLSLFAILFAYDAINGEKERGTLRLTLANSVPKSTYILGKVLGSFLALAIPLLIPILLGCLILLAMGIPVESDDWFRLALVVAGGYLYFGVFLTLSLFLSSLTRKPATSFLFLLVCWILSVMIIPRTAVLLAGRAVNVPSVDEIASQKSRYSASLWQEHRKKMADFRAPEGTEMDKLMEKFQKYMSDLGEERMKKMDLFTSRLNEERANAQVEQERIAFALARISPSAAFSLASSAIASTGIHLRDEYKRQAENYQRAYAEFMKGKTGTTPGGGFLFKVMIGDEEEEKTPINLSEIPEFQYKEPPVRAALGEITIDFGILGLFNILFFAGAFFSFLRFDPR